MKKQNTTIVMDARCEFAFDYPTTYLQTGDVTIKGQEKKCAIKLMSLNSFVTNMSDPRFIWEMERLQSLDWSALLIEGDWAQIVKKYYDHPARPEAVIGSMLALSVKYGIPVGPIATNDMQWVIESALLAEYAEGDKPIIQFSRPPLLPLNFVDTNRFSLSGLRDFLILERWSPNTIQLMAMNKIAAEHYIVNKLEQIPFFGVFYQPDQELNTIEFETKLKALQKSVNFVLVIDGNRDEGLNQGLKRLWASLLKSLNMK